MFSFRTFQSRLLFFFAGFYILAQVLAFLVVDAASRFNARSQINAELTSGGRVFDWVMQSQSERFLDAAQIISADLGFKIAYGSKDRSTLLAAMKNHAARVKADMMLLLSPDHTVIADTHHPKTGPVSFPFPRLIKAAEQSGKASAMAFSEGHLYRFVVVPLRAPVPVAWVVVGYTIDDALARQFKMLTSLEVTFVVEEGKDRVPITAVSTLGSALRRELEATLPSAGWKPGGPP